MMRIIIDLQGSQAENRQRGIGRYTISLVKAIIRNTGSHEIILALNGSFSETIEHIRASFGSIIPQKNIRVWYVKGEANNLTNDNIKRSQVAELVREAFIASLEPDIVFIPSVFEGLVDNACISMNVLYPSLLTAVTLHDLIPLIYPKPYLENPTVKLWYERQLSHFRCADLIIAISESSRREAIKYLNFPERSVVNASEGADPHFCVKLITDKEKGDLSEKYGINKEFVMYGGGIEHRKNTEGLIRAYATLPKKIRIQYQLAIVCGIQSQDKERLLLLAKRKGLLKEDIIFTGFVPEDDLVALYNLCKVFVFPSWHEGFGLPVLEAMSCGSAVIGANTSSIPEVIGRNDALFDPRNDKEITAKLLAVLTDDKFRVSLEKHGLKQAKKFSWDKSAICTIKALEKSYKDQQQIRSIKPSLASRPKMAFVSPLPPGRSGISDYSAELLPELFRYYDIEVIIEQDKVTVPWVNANCPIRDVAYFKAHANDYERVLYHFGNSDFHQHMFSLLEEIPGVVVLHDFFLSGIVAHMEVTGYKENAWVMALYNAHGYSALQHRFHAKNTADVIWKYPCNHNVVSNATGIIVHAENSKRLARQWYPSDKNKDWAVIQHLRVPVINAELSVDYKKLNLKEDDFVVCSFGLLGLTKLNHQLLKAWLASELAKDENCILIFVGENQAGEYGQQLLKAIKQSGLSKRIRITGWADTKTFRQYLSVADIGVQLRTKSRGETSGTVLDCMNYSVTTIVNENGSMADLPDDAVYKIPDKFINEQLMQALNELWKNSKQREKLGQSARTSILKNNMPKICANQYFSAIENFEKNSMSNINALIKKISKISSNNEEELLGTAEAISRSIPPLIPERQLFVDVSELVQRDNKSGIQRVVKNILHEWLIDSPKGLRIEPVYAIEDQLGYRYARQFTMKFINCPDNILKDDLIDYQASDIFIGLDLQPTIVTAQKEFYQQLRRHGVQVKFVVYDLLCILMPQYFAIGAAKMYTKWLEVVAESDGAICISNTVADEFQTWLDGYTVNRLRSFKLSWFHLGADIKKLVEYKETSENDKLNLNKIKNTLSFLMVGTIEPRKGHTQTLASFEKLWLKGKQLNLVIVGKQGWMVKELIEKIRQHPELNNRLFWFEGISDEHLEKIYSVSVCLIAASEGEGFGLPLIEAAKHKLPIIARDIPVFREVAGEHALYFKKYELAVTIEKWLALVGDEREVLSEKISWQTWKKSSNNFLEKIVIT